MIEDVFESYGLPTELKYMAVIESALAQMPYRGRRHRIWQFMNSTGRYGATINSIIDERRDPVKATHAAARYLKDLYKIYNDWILVIAAYNCGLGNVNKAIRRSGNQKITGTSITGFHARPGIYTPVCGGGICHDVMPSIRSLLHP